MQVLAFDDELQVKRSAAIGLGNLGLPSGIQPLLLAIQSKDAELRTFAAEALAKIKAPETVEILTMALQGGPTMQLGAMEALAMIGDPRALGALEAMVPASDPAIEAMRQAAMATLGTADQQAHQALVAQLTAPDAGLRARAVDSLAARGPAEFSHVVRALEDADPYVRARAAHALGSFADPGALEPLAQRLRDPDALVRSAAAEALGTIGDPRAITWLTETIDALEDDSSRREMLDALGKLTKQAVR
ncbi:PBS lyase HEAT-like repeat protein [compost metagenome]